MSKGKRWAKHLSLALLAVIAWLTISALMVLITKDAVTAAAISNIITAITIFCLRTKGKIPAAEQHRTVTSMPTAIVSVILAVVLTFFAAQILGMRATGLQDAGFQEHNAALAHAPLWLVLISTLILAPIGEEFLMRGWVQPHLRSLLGPNLTVLITSTIFAVLHGNLTQFTVTIVLGSLLGYVYENYGRIWVTCGAHMLFNMLAIMIPIETIKTLSNTPWYFILVLFLLVTAQFLIYPSARKNEVGRETK